MTKEESALFRAELFERAAKVLLGQPVHPPAMASAPAASPAAAEAPEEREQEIANEQKGATRD